MLLELNEQFLRKHDFKDVWKNQKSRENHQALCLLQQRIQKIDLIDQDAKWHEIIRGKKISSEIKFLHKFFILLQEFSLAIFSMPELQPCKNS